jgi:hypothetical protein
MSLSVVVGIASRGLDASLGGASLGLLRLCPHSSQNLLLALMEAPHFGQESLNLCPHSLQNLAPSRLSNWHSGHFILCPPLCAYQFEKV